MCHLFVWCEIIDALDVDLVGDEYERLVDKERLDVVKKRDLLVNRVAALLGHVHDEQDGGAQVRHGRDGLHLDGVALLERVVEYAGRVDHLPAQVLVVGVTDVERLGGERVGLHLDVGERDLVEKARLAHVGKAADEQCARVRVDGRQAGQVLTNLLQVLQALALALYDRAHTVACNNTRIFSKSQIASAKHKCRSKSEEKKHVNS